MKPQDRALANIAEAAKRVMNKETEVQPKDKDFVDLHSIDKEKRRGSTPITEKDIEEANEFTKAAAKAAVAGDDEFEFDGKKFPTEMDVEVAKKILGESAELDEKEYEFVSTFDKKLIKPNITMRDVIKLYPKTKFSNRSLWRGHAANDGPGGVVELEKNLAARFYFKDKEHPGKKITPNDEFTITAIWSFKKPHVPTSIYGSFDEAIDESTNLDEATVNVEIPDPFFLRGSRAGWPAGSYDEKDLFSRNFNKLLKKYRVKGELLGEPKGMDMPEVQLTGKKKDLERILADPDGWDDDGWLADGIKESADSEKAIEEAFIDVDTADPKSIEFAKLMKKYRVKGRIITMKGPGGGMPLVRLTGKKKDLEGILKDPMGWQDDGFLAGFIEESADPGKAIDEAIKGLSEEQIDELIGGLLKKGASALGKAVKSRVTKSGRADRADKKHKLAVRGKKLEIKQKINDILDKRSKAQKKKRDVEAGSKAAEALDAKIDGYKERIDQLKDKLDSIAESDIKESVDSLEESNG